MARAPITESGYPSIWRDACETIHVPNTSKVNIELLRGDCAIIIAGALAWIHRNVRNIEPPDGHRNWWGHDNSSNNAVANSNHYGGIAADFCADELPWQKKRMPEQQIQAMHRLLQLFEGLLYWGGDWNRVDEMHIQMNSGTYMNPRVAEFANRLRNGYLNLFKAMDPNEFPLPLGYYYGPLDGPMESISGEFSSDSQAAKDGLGRWQAKLGIPVTKKWNDGVTPQAAATLQKERGWKPYLAGLIYKGEWDEVINNGWKLPDGWKPASVELPDDQYPLTLWGDYSQYQSAYVSDAYPYPIISFRSSIADSTARTSVRHGGTDLKYVENISRSKQLIESGKLKKVIAYHFWVPGFDNFGAFRAAIEESGGIFDELAWMIDVEDGGEKWRIGGDQTTGVLDFISKANLYFDNDDSGCVYWNPNSNPNLLVPDRFAPGTKWIIPRYSGRDVAPVTPAGVRVFGHQYTDKENTPPFGPTDMNQAKCKLSTFLEVFGKNGQSAPEPEPEPEPIPEPVPEPGDDLALVMANAAWSQFDA